jgi:putative glutamine amidotransferase
LAGLGCGGRRAASRQALYYEDAEDLLAGLRAVAHAPDGVVEAFEVEGARAFSLAVQWHPEWRCWESAFYSAIFAAFGQACRARRTQRLLVA